MGHKQLFGEVKGDLLRQSKKNDWSEMIRNCDLLKKCVNSDTFGVWGKGVVHPWVLESHGN